MKITGERVASPEGGFNPTWQRHVAAYALAEPELGRAACSTSAAASATATTCSRRGRRSGSTSTPRRSPGQDRETVVADMRALPFADGSFASVLSVQSLEHVPDPERVVAEVARVLRARRRRRLRHARTG